MNKRLRKKLEKQRELPLYMRVEGRILRKISINTHAYVHGLKLTA